MIAYAKRDGDDTVIVICSLDPDQGVETDVYLDFAWLGDHRERPSSCVTS